MTKKLEVDGAQAAPFQAQSSGVVGWETYASIFADGLVAVIPGEHTTKLFFFEQTADGSEDGVRQRVNCCVTMPNDRFSQTVKLLEKIVAEEGKNDKEHSSSSE